MGKKLLSFFAVLTFVLFLGSATHASQLYEFSFTAADIMNFEIHDGTDDTTAAENSLFNGARLTRNDGQGSYKRSYIESQNTDFESWAQSTQHSVNTINLWGFDGRGAGWGEDYKHQDSGFVTAPGGWINWETVGWNNGWGTNPNPNTDTTVGWYVGSGDDGFKFNDADLASKKFTFTMVFDETDWLFGADTNGAPNTLGGEMTFWFGTWMGDETNPYQYIYEGNMVLTGTAIPEPTTMLLFGVGLLGIAGVSRRRKA